MEKTDLWVWLERILTALPIVVLVIVWLVSWNNTGKLSLDLPEGLVMPFLTGFVVAVPIWMAAGQEATRRLTQKSFADLEKKINSINPVYVQTFGKVEDYYDFLEFCARTCKESWTDMGGFDPLQSNIRQKVRERYDTARARLGRRLHNFRYLGYIRNEQHLQRVLKMVESPKNTWSKVRAYESDMVDPSKIEVTIVDRRLLVMGYFRPDSDQRYVAINDPQTIALFEQYYDDIWGKKQNLDLKIEDQVFEENLMKIEEIVRAGQTAH